MVQVATIKALKKAEMMKEKMQGTTDILVDNEAWMLQQQLQGIYRKILIMDLEYALDKKVEQDLWNYGSKNSIALLQAIVKDKKHAKRTEAQAMLHWCLEAASGTYLSLLQDICAVFDLDLVFRRCGLMFGCTTKTPTVTKDSMPSKLSCHYICHHCLVHLGDIARYRNQNRQAEAYYRYAVMLSPTSGQPYNQLAILEAIQGDKLSTVYHYVRAVSLAHPFPAASTNLSITFEKHSDYEIKLDGHSKLSPYEYVAVFLKFHGLLHNLNSLETAEKLVQLLTTSLTSHIATESLSSWKLVQIVSINIFALQRMVDSQLTELESRAKLLITHFFAGCLNAFLLPVYTIKAGDSLLDFFAMPAIKMCLEWIRLHPEILRTSAFQQRLQIWPGLCRLLNEVQRVTGDFTTEKYKHVALPEDRDLHGFQPLEKVLQLINFQSDELKTDSRGLSKLRAVRVVEFGVWLAARKEISLISASSGTDGTRIAFESKTRPEPPGDLLKELEKLTPGKASTVQVSETNGSTTGSSTPDSVGFFSSCLSQSQENTHVATEKRPGILKGDTPTSHRSEEKTPAIGARVARNVALASIMNQKVSEDVKQVKFQTPSPVKIKNNQNNVSNKKTNNAKPVNGQLITSTKVPAVKEKISAKSDNEAKSIDSTLVQQQKLMDVLDKNHVNEERKSQSADSNETKMSPVQPKGKKTEESKEKKELLTALLDGNKGSKQTQAMSGLLNLNKQQQELLTNSKQAPRPQNNNRQNAQHKVADKIEAARKEYENAMMVLQQRRQGQHPEHLHYTGEQFSYEHMMPPQPAPVVQPPHMFLSMNPPPMVPMPFAFKYQPDVMLPWQEPEVPPMPPAWWTDRPPPPQMMPEQREPPGYQQLNTYSLFSNPMATESEANYSMPGRIVNQQSFWSGPGPSPLERLLEQQRKQLQEAPPNT